MGYDTLAGDWEFAGLAQVGGAEMFGGGVYMFRFRSRIANVQEDVFFGGGGIGAGGGIGGASMSDLSTGQPSYSPIRCVREFHLRDLHNALGRVSTIGASLAVGYGQVYISASSGINANGFDDLFTTQGGHGISVGVGLGATLFYGVWRVVRFWNT